MADSALLGDNYQRCWTPSGGLAPTAASSAVGARPTDPSAADDRLGAYSARATLPERYR